MQRFNLFHETIYDFQSEVTLGPHKLLIRPREGHDIRIESSSLAISPNAAVKWYRDESDNSVAITRFSEHTRQLKIVSEVRLQHYDEWPLDFLVDDYAVLYPFAYENEEHMALTPYLRDAYPQKIGTDGSELFDSWIGKFNQSDSIETYSLLNLISETIATEHQYGVR